MHELELFKSYINTNHLFENSLGASYNPAFLLLQPSNFKSKLLNNLVFQHELAHALLNSTFYGQLIFSLKLIEMEYFKFFFRKGLNIEHRNKLIKIRSINHQLIKSWSYTQEGYATYTDYYHLTTTNSMKDDKLYDDLVGFLETESIYSVGFKIFMSLKTWFPNIAYLIYREVSNIDFINIWQNASGSLMDKIDKNNPDNYIKKSLQEVINFGKGKIFIIDSSKSIDYGAGRSILKSINNKLKFKYNITSYFKSIHYIFDFFINELNLEAPFREMLFLKLVTFDRDHSENYSNLYNGDFRLLFFHANIHPEKIEFLGKHQDYKMQKEIINLYDTNELINNVLDNKKVNNFNFDKKSSLSELIENIFTLKKDEIIMKQIVIKCSKIEAESLSGKFFDLEQKNSIKIDDNKERLSHWIEVVSVIISLTSASLQAIEIIRKWLREKKEDETTIVIIIDDTEFELPSDYRLIEEKLKEITTSKD